MTRLRQEETGNKPKQNTGMRKECGIQGEENVMGERNNSQGNKDIKSTQNNANRNSEEKLNQIEDETSNDNNDVRNDEDGVPLQTSYITPIDTMVYPSSESPNKETNESTNQVFPSHPQRNCPTKKPLIFYGYD